MYIREFKSQTNEQRHRKWEREKERDRWIGYLLEGVLTRALEMFWSMKKRRDRLKPSPAAASTAPAGRRWRGASSNIWSRSLYLNGFTVIEIENIGTWYHCEPRIMVMIQHQQDLLTNIWGLSFVIKKITFIKCIEHYHLILVLTCHFWIKKWHI